MDTSIYILYIYLSMYIQFSMTTLKLRLIQNRMVFLKVRLLSQDWDR